ncbi:hypothetical protein [Gallaecimonas sp. GXIMD4217]|uniref:hypothetical protein n=1 Tax=Gallaecimonas sp. GXIMD4217 TaxID=3131927 RepID=UPI00311AF6AE
MQKFTDWLGALSLRERGLVMLAGLILLGGVLGLSWLEPKLAGLAKERQALARQLSRVEELARTRTMLESRLARDPVAELRLAIAELKQSRNDQQQQLQQRTRALVPVQAMAPMLESLLAKTPGLQLQSLKSLPPEPLLSLPDDGGSDLNLYRHPLTLTLKGGYLPLLTFLQRSEQLPWQLFWQSLTFEQGQDGETEIHVYTLGTSRHYLGV